MDSHLLDGMSSSKLKLPRKATIEDLELCCLLATEFYLKGPWGRHIPLDPQTIVERIKYFIEDEDSFVVVSDNDLMIGTLAPYIVNQNVLTANELIWYCKENGKLCLEMFEQWATEKYASVIVMSQIINEKEAPMRRLYQKYGYTAIEMAHIKEI